MKYKGIIAYYTELIDGFFSNYSRVARTQGTEDIHQMRVHIKKLRALWLLAEVQCEGTWDKQPCFDAVARLFRKAGRLREYQVLRGLSSSLPSSVQADYHAHLNEGEKVARRKLTRATIRFDHKSFEAHCNFLFRKLENLSEAKIVENSIRFIHSRDLKIMRLRSKLPDDRYLHKIRIELKVVHELLTLIGENSTSDLYLLRRSEIKALNSALGEWHDHCDFLNSLSDFHSSHRQLMKGDKSTGLIKRLKKKQHRRRDAILIPLDAYLKREELRNESVRNNPIA